MSKYWIKLWHDFLHDRKTRELPEYEQLRFIKLLLIAGEFDQNGLLPPVETIAYDFGIMTKDAPSKVDSTLTRLQQAGVVDKSSEGWFIVKWDKRQSSADPTAAERQRRHRQKEQERDITRDPPASTSSSDSSSLNNKGEFSQAETSAAYSEFGNNGTRESMRLYTLVTNQPAPPRDQVDRLLEDMATVLDHYKTVDAAVPDGKRVFARWCGTTGKSGKPYSAVNVGWLGWWLDDIAPRPEKAELSVIERIFGEGGIK